MKVKVYKERGFLIIAALGSGSEFAFYLYKDDEVLEKRPYTSSPATTFNVSAPGKYQAKVFVLSPEGEKTRTWSAEVEVEAHDLDFDDLNVVLPLDKEKWPHWLEQLKDIDVPEGEPWYILEPKRYTAESIMTRGWRLGRYPALNPVNDIDWEAPGLENRSWGFHLHAWEFIDPVFKEYQKTGNAEFLQWMYNAAKKWWSFARENDNGEAMVWYDMSLSLRTPRLARLLILLAQSDSPEHAVELFEPMVKHCEMLFKREAYNPNNNHGFFAAAASVELPKLLPFLPWAESLAVVGEIRMKTMVEKQFAPDGGHLEHSPDYHRMLLGSFEKGLDSGLISEEETARRIRHAANVLGWMIQPDGKIVQFGDSPAFDVDATGLRSVDENTEFILSNGLRGKPTVDELCVLPSSGYAFVRSPQPNTSGERVSSGYLAFQAGFHSRAHKHADDLTFTWFDCGYEILVDAGRYGYEQLLPPDAPERKQGFYYGAPERMYVEGTIAHNTVQVDDENIERRDRAAYGSALGRCTKTDDRFILRGEVEHDKYLHERMLRYEPGTSLEVIDTLSPSKGEIDAVSWFNVNGDFEAEVVDNSLVFHEPEAKFKIRVICGGELIMPVRGQQSPMRGWRSRVDRELIPVWNFGFRQVLADKARQNVKFEIIKTQLENK